MTAEEVIARVDRSVVPLHDDPDAARWAAEFVETWKRVYPDREPPDEDWMQSWFANAMMAALDASARRKR